MELRQKKKIIIIMNNPVIYINIQTGKKREKIRKWY